MKSTWIRTFLMVALFCGLVFAAAEVVEACPTCSTAVGEDDKANASTAGAGYSYSIALMMATPFTILGVFGFVLYRSFNKAMAEREAEHNAALAAAAKAEAPVSETVEEKTLAPTSS